MKKATLSFLALLVCTGLVLAQETMKKDKMMMAKGTVTKVDEAGKMMTMKDSKGKEMMISWDSSTKVTGDMKEGSMATVHYMMMDGKMMAHGIKMSGKMMSDKKM